MWNKAFQIILISCIALIVFSCAKRGRISGGEKDITPPVMTSANPENYSTNFKGNEVKIYFDEYIKLENLRKNLIISPPMKYNPIISPMGTASKYVTIKILDTLPENTTYSINFGQSIVDNNEGNPYSYFKYVFSTGDYIDSLSVGGKILDAVNRTPEDFVSVMLYRVDSTFTDSIIYKEKPTYIANTLDSTNVFMLENLKEGKYLMTALKEETPNYLYNQKEDKIGFLNEFVTIPSDSIYSVKLFKEELDFKAGKPKSKTRGKIAFGYEGDAKDMKINLLSDTPETFEYKITQARDKDTLLYWYKPQFEQDSLIFEVTNNEKFVDTFTVRLRKAENDSLIVYGTKGTISFDEEVAIWSNTAIKGLNINQISMIDKDSAQVSIKKIYRGSLKNKVSLVFEPTESNKYEVTVLPGAITDIYGQRNDTIKFNMSTRTYADYGNIRVRLKNAPNHPVIVQLTDNQGTVKYEKRGRKEDEFDFRNITASKYFLRVVIDKNNNGKFDSGSYLKKIQPERISYFPKEIDVRPNWDFDQEFILK